MMQTMYKVISIKQVIQKVAEEVKPTNSSG